MDPPPEAPPGKRSNVACARAVRRTVSQLARTLRPNLRAAGISGAKLSVIVQIHRAGPLTPTALALREGVKIQSLTRLLAELARDGWVHREPHESDGRQSLLSLTAHGRKRLVESARVQDDRLAQVIDCLSDAERALVLEACTLFERLAEAFRQNANAATLPQGAPS